MSVNDGIDTEYLVTIIDQVRCKNNGIKSHVNKEKFKEISGTMINGEHLDFGYLREKTAMIDMLLDTIEYDILKKSGKLRQLNN